MLPYTSITKYRILYADTDMMGVVYYGNYGRLFEMGRTELLRVNGLAYRKLEEAGTFFVVAELSIKFRQPARYDEKLQLETSCSGVTASRVEHTYKLTQGCDGVILAEGSSVLACIDGQGKIRRIPEFMYPES